MADTDSPGGEHRVPYEKRASAPMFSRCSKNGLSGWKHAGCTLNHCYTGPNGKAQCVKNAISIHGAKKFSTMMTNVNDGVYMLDKVTIAQLLSDDELTKEEKSCLAKLYHPTDLLEQVIWQEYMKESNL